MLSLLKRHEHVQADIVFAAAVLFKNFVKRNWLVDDNGTDQVLISGENGQLIKSEIVALLLEQR